MEKLSIHQFLAVSLAVLLGTTFFPIAQVAALQAGRDGWLAVLPGYALGIPLALMVLALGKRHPGQNLLQIAEALWGKWLGKLYGALYTITSLYFCALLTQQVQDIANRTLLALVPGLLVIFSFILLLFYLVKSGIEVYGRFAEFVFPIVTFGLMGVIILVLPRFEWEEFRPLLGNGLMPVLWATVKISNYPMQYVQFLAGVLPFLPLKDYGGLKARVWRSVLIVGLLNTIVAFAEILVFGPGETVRIDYGVLSLANMIEISKVVSGLEAIFMGFWVGASILKTGAYYFMSVWGLKTVGGFKGRLWPLLAVGLTSGMIAKYSVGGSWLFLKIGFMGNYVILPFVLIGTLALWVFDHLRRGRPA